MAHSFSDKHGWDDAENYYAYPLMDYSNEKYRKCAPYIAEAKEERERRSTFTVLAKFFFFCTAMILFCVLMYIPVYNKANDQIPKAIVAGWSLHANRDTKIYVQPNNVTSIFEPKHLCTSKKEKKDLYLLIVVCSATSNFEQRKAIRETWGDYTSYVKLSKVFNKVKDRYKNYNYTYDLYERSESKNISNIEQILAKALSDDVKEIDERDVKEERVTEEKRFDDEDGVIPEFDMDKELNEITDNGAYDYDYPSNIMKIPPRGYEDNLDLDRVMKMIKEYKKMTERDGEIEKVETNGVRDFKLVFLLGLPKEENSTDVQAKIEEESIKYEDILQESFVDSYNNLTLKSIMLLKWVTKCNDSVRYILKTDDDMYINVPYLMLDLRNRTREHDSKEAKGKEYLLIGDLICGARPVMDTSNKWYSPRYMYSGRVYPRYLSGTGYVFSRDAAKALYRAALNTPYFHLEDIFITGMCSIRSTPRINPTDDPFFSYAASFRTETALDRCAAAGHVTTHRASPTDMYRLRDGLMREGEVDLCERKRLTQVRKDRLKPKKSSKKTPKFGVRTIK